VSETFQEPLSPAQATKLIREIVRFGTVGLTGHCRKESMPHRGITFQDLLAVLANGEVREAPVFHAEHQQFRYRVEGTTIDDEEAIAVTVIMDHRSLLVITVF
jgi:hypothetical protein